MERNRYVQSGMFSYVATQQYDVILFGESIYHVSRGKIKAMLARYSKYLKESGDFIVRMWDGSDKYKTINGPFSIC